jgi:hypothetical protein
LIKLGSLERGFLKSTFFIFFCVCVCVCVNEIIRGLDGKREIGINKNQKKMKSKFNVLVINSLKSHDEEAKESSTSPN